MRNNGCHPCHRCLVGKGDLEKLGAPNDTERMIKTRCEAEQATLVKQARKDIEDGSAFDGTKVEAALFPKSLTVVEVCFQAG